MATYKVIQDIEAEDKLLGPFTLRQFIYLIIVAVSLFIGYRLALVQWFLVLPLLPHTIFFALLAAPIGREQSSEIWLLAKIRFIIKPRRRIWDQTGIKELVTITAPKKIEKTLTKQLSQTEVRSRLETLANTIDSRGWAIKNVNVNLFAQAAYANMGNSDRLVDASTIPQQVPSFDVTPGDDMLDERNNPTAQNLDKMINASSKARRNQLVAQMKQASQPPAGGQPGPASQQPSSQPGAGFMGTAGAMPQPASFPGSNLVTPQLPPAQQQPAQRPQSSRPLSEEELLEKIHAEKEKPKNYGHMRVIKPIEEQEAETKAKAAQAAQQPAAPPPVTPPPDPAILELANNDDLNVATIAREAHKQTKGKQLPDDEVVISLH